MQITPRHTRHTGTTFTPSTTFTPGYLLPLSPPLLSFQLYRTHHPPLTSLSAYPLYHTSTYHLQASFLFLVRHISSVA
ncbi:hypothetical protein E2C01_073620 [Portunus trituberculatus]|uniref:Uncharacterized protein n=1 Tax=Portunus trituberculatus TaxID=210409 RepID=A0A5B7IC59_PORTR|nr:hypothetical protein [Portunus trituberculatus]